MTYSPPPGQPGQPPGLPGQSPGSPGQPQYPGATGGPAAPQAKGFFGSLFDFSFNHFVTPIIIRVLYVLGIIGISLGYFFIVIGAFLNGVAQGLITMLLGLVLAVVYLAFWRVMLEFFLAVVRMSEDIRHRGLTGGR